MVNIARPITETSRAVVHAVAGAFGAVLHAVAEVFRAVVHGVTRALRWFKMSPGRVAFKFRRTVLTVSVESGVARVVAFKGKRVVAWNSAAVDPAPGPPGAEEELLEKEARSLRRVLEGMPARRARVLSDLPLYAPLMRYLRLPKAHGRYLEEMVLSEVLETIPFEREEVDISWRLRRDSAGQEAFAIAVPKGQVDSHVGMVKEAGLSLSAAYTKATALAFAAGVPDALAVHLEGTRVTAVLVREGAPRAVHQVAVPAEGANPLGRADALGAMVDQVTGPYEALGPESEGRPLVVVLTGQGPAARGPVGVLSQALGRPVAPFAPPVDYPEGFPQEEYAANLGLFLADQARGKAWGKPPARVGPAINVLPERHRPRPLPVAPMAVSVALFLLVGLALVVAGPVNDKTQAAAQLSYSLDQVESEYRTLRTAVGQEKARLRSLEEARGQASGMESGLAELNMRVDTLLARLTAITEENVPAGVELSSLAPEEQGFILAGNAGSYRDVFEYVENLRTSPHFEEARVKQLVRSGPDAVGFTISATIPQPMAEEQNIEEKKQP